VIVENRVESKKAKQEEKEKFPNVWEGRKLNEVCVPCEKNKVE
jgi:hypothetical protein